MSTNHDENSLPDYENGDSVAKGALLAVVAVAATIALVFGVYLFATKDSEPAAETDPDPSTSSSHSAEGPAAESPCPTPDVQPVSEPAQFDAAPDPATAGKGVLKGTISTSCGDISVDLFADKAPQAVASFKFLSEKDFYKDTPCHRLTTTGIFVLQCGDPTASGMGGPGYNFGPVENAPEDALYNKGYLAMARAADPASNGSQFFIVYKDSPIPDNNGAGYTVFGEVTSGIDIVEKIADGGLGPDGTAPKWPIALLGTSVDDA